MDVSFQASNKNLSKKRFSNKDSKADEIEGNVAGKNKTKSAKTNKTTSSNSIEPVAEGIEANEAENN